MSQVSNGMSLPNLQLGDVLPSFKLPQTEQATHLFVSLSELIQENIFYHPELLQHIENLSDTDKNSVDALLNGQDLATHFVGTLVELIEAAIQPHHQQVRVCLSDADSYAYRALIGGEVEQEEINPMIGLRGVSRFASPEHEFSFQLECDVVKSLRAKGIDIEIVIPFVRALSDAAMIIDRLAVQGLPRGLNGLKVLYCCDTPASILLADKLLQYFDGLVVNVGNLTQLTLGVDAQNEALLTLLNPENDAVLMLLTQASKSANQANKPCVVYCQNLIELPKVQEVLAELDSVQVLATL
ncbi:MAG: putative PEP-binding protein [Vibrio sp.]